MKIIKDNIAENTHTKERLLQGRIKMIKDRIRIINNWIKNNKKMERK